MSDKKIVTAQAEARVDIPIGVSACVLGEEVRFDGGHKLSRFVRDTLGAYVRFVPVCPEVGIGLPIPRDSLRLVRDDGDPSPPRLIATKTDTDRTEAMLRFSDETMDRLAGEGLCGYILQKNSPTCGMERVRVRPPGGGRPKKNGQGVYARVLMERFPHLPVEEDGRLHDPGLRENFLERVFAYRRLRLLFGRPWTLGELVAFHSREKLLVLAHDRPTYTALGRLVAHAKGRPQDEVAREYEALFLIGLRRMATPGKQTNVLQHAAGYFKKLLDEGDRRELREVIDSYRAGLVPLIVPITLLRHHVRRHDVRYLAEQSYLDPHPAELMLRNHS